MHQGHAQPEARTVWPGLPLPSRALQPGLSAGGAAHIVLPSCCDRPPRLVWLDRRAAIARAAHGRNERRLACLRTEPETVPRPARGVTSATRSCEKRHTGPRCIASPVEPWSADAATSMECPVARSRAVRRAPLALLRAGQQVQPAVDVPVDDAGPQLASGGKKVGSGVAEEACPSRTT